jgi:hypothetical protein
VEGSSSPPHFAVASPVDPFRIGTPPTAVVPIITKQRVPRMVVKPQDTCFGARGWG